MSYWGSGTLKIVIPVENHPQKPKNRLADYHPLWGWGGVNQDPLDPLVRLSRLPTGWWLKTGRQGVRSSTMLTSKAGATEGLKLPPMYAV